MGRGLAEAGRNLELWLKERFHLSMEEAEDVAQDARIIAWTKRGEDDVSAEYLRAVGAYVALNYRRGRKRFKAMLSRLASVEPDDQDEQFRGAEVRCFISTLCALAGVERIDALFVTTVVLQEATHRQLAVYSELSEATVRKRVVRAIQCLRQCDGIDSLLPEVQPEVRPKNGCNGTSNWLDGAGTLEKVAELQTKFPFAGEPASTPFH